MKYVVNPPHLNAAADAVSRALELLGTVRIEEDLTPLTVAFAGGRTTAQLKSVTNLWQVQLAGARAQIRALGGALAEASEGYNALESLLAHQLGASGTEQS